MTGLETSELEGWGRRVTPWPPSAIVVAGALLVAAYVSLLLFVMSHGTYRTWVALLLAPILVALAIPVLRRESVREGDPHLFWFLVGVLLLHLALGLVGYWVAFGYYEGVADVSGYHRIGMALARRFRDGNFTLNLLHGDVTGTNWPRFLTGVLYTVTGPSILAGFLFYAWLGFWGEFYLYRAFRLAVQEGRPQTYARLLFLFPPVAFWSSYMGKDSWTVFALGIAVLGVAHVLTGRARRGLVPLAIGAVAMLVVRPHIAGMVGVALAFAYLVRKPKGCLREAAPVAKVVGLVLVTALAVVLVARTEQFLRAGGIDTEQGLTSVLYQTSAGGAFGGSSYSPPIVSGPREFPAATFTVLFRPLPNEAASPLEWMAAIAGLFLLLLTLVRWRWGWTALLSIRRQPFVAFCIAYVFVGIIGFSAFANFGLLDRERSQLLPLYFVLLSVPPTTALNHRPRKGKHASGTDRVRHDR